MPLRTDVYYRELAQKVLDAAGIDEPPISLAELAAHLAIPIRSYTFPSFFSGAIVNEHGLPVVLLNGARSEVLQRSALAHLLGHLILAVEEPGQGFGRDEEGEHREAQVIASELVLPSHLVMDQSRKWFNDYRYLARLFAVPETEMLGKMRAMGLIKDRGIHWDY